MESWIATVFCILLFCLDFDAGPTFHHLDGGAHVEFSATLCNCSTKHGFGDASKGEWQIELIGRLEGQADVLVHPFCGKVGGEVPFEDEWGLVSDQSGLGG